MYCGLAPKKFLYQRCCRLQSPLAKRIAELGSLEIISAAEDRHSAIVEMRYNVQDVWVVSRHFLGRLFEFDQVIAEEFSLAQCRQTPSQGERAQSGLVENSCTLVTLYDNGDDPHQGQL
jgi:hypothetical protein